jgi:multidrug transporter EmrE-like cation transporter
MANTDLVLYISVLLSILFVLGIKYYLKYDNVLFLVGVLLIQIIAIYIYIELLKNNNSGTLYCISKIVSIIIILILSILLFGEQMTLKQWIGIILACVGLYLIMS